MSLIFFIRFYYSNLSEIIMNIFYIYVLKFYDVLTFSWFKFMYIYVTDHDHNHNLCSVEGFEKLSVTDSIK